MNKLKQRLQEARKKHGYNIINERIIITVREWLEDAPQEVQDIIDRYYLCQSLTKRQLTILAKFYLKKVGELR